MGQLLDKGAITFQDLGFATDRAYDKRVRDAAKSLLYHSLIQTQDDDTSVGPLNVVDSGRRSFSEYKQFQFTLIYGAVLGVVMGMGLLLLIQTLFSRTEREHSEVVIDTGVEVILVVIVIAVMVFAALLFMFLAEKLILKRLEVQIKRYRKGQVGEERVVNTMYHVLDGNWYLFRNVEIPGIRGDTDLLLVGPQGVFSLEVKAYNGEYRNIGEQWERRLGSRWLTMSRNPSRQAKRNAAGLSNILRNQNMKQWITPVIVWANPESVVTVQNTTVPVWQLQDIGERLQNTQSSYALTNEKKDKIIHIIKSFVNKEG